MGKPKSAYNWQNTGQWALYDGSTFETVLTSYPISFYDDFITDAIIKASGVPGWTLLDSGNATEALTADQHGGVFTLALTNTSEKQYAGMYFGDELVLNLDKGPIIEIRAAVSTTPTGLAEIYFGVANNTVEGPLTTDGPTVHAMFNFDASLAATIYTDDTSNDNDAVSTGVTVTEGTNYVYRIDFTTITNVKFFINGARVGAATTCDMSTSSNVMVQPYLMCHKESGTGVGTLKIDYVKFWSGR